MRRCSASAWCATAAQRSIAALACADARLRRALQGLARSVALFAGSVVLMRQFGELMAI